MSATGAVVGALMLAAALLRPLSAQDDRAVEAEGVLRTLVETYGASGTEGPTREAVQRLLPAWARAETDTAGNLWVRVGTGGAPVVFVAHLDEIGFRVSAINPDGSLELARLGGFFPSLFEAQPALLHTGRGTPVPAVFRPRAAGEAPTRRTPEAIVGDVGTTSRAATEALGVRVGHTMTMPKRYVRLAGTRITVELILEKLAAGGTIEQLLEAHPRLTEQAIRAALAFAAEALRADIVYPLAQTDS